MTKDCSKAADTLSRGKYSCVIEKNGVVISARRGPGVKPILSALERYPHDLADACVADTVTGRAAAMILHLGKIRFLYSQVASKTAHDYLLSHGIGHDYGSLVDAIANRTMDGLCPIEQSVISTDDAAKGLFKIKETIAGLMAGSVK